MNKSNEHADADLAIVVRALEASDQYFAHRDQMNAAVHLAPTRYSPATALVQQGLDAAKRLQEAAGA